MMSTNKKKLKQTAFNNGCKVTEKTSHYKQNKKIPLCFVKRLYHDRLHLQRPGGMSGISKTSLKTICVSLSSERQHPYAMQAGTANIKYLYNNSNKSCQK